MSRTRGHAALADGGWAGLVARIVSSAPKLPRAACRGKPGLFDAEDGEHQERRAGAICRGCPELQPCREWADQQHALSGVYAGTLRRHDPGTRNGGGQQHGDD